MNHIIQRIPIAQQYNSNFNQVCQLDSKGKLYLPQDLIQFEIPSFASLVLVQDTFHQIEENFLFGFIVTSEYGIDRKLKEVYPDLNSTLESIYPFVSFHKLDSKNRADVKKRLEEVLDMNSEFRLKGMGEYFLIEKP